MLPLADRRILITRSRHQASALSEQLHALGATPILIPTIELAPPDTFAPLDKALAALAHFDWLVFTSANAVEAFHHRLLHTQTPTPQTQTAAIGPATAQAAKAIGLHVTLIPPTAIAESLAEALLPAIRPGTRILLVRAATARNLLPEALTAAGAEVTIAEAYRTIVPPDSIATLQHLFADPARHPDAVTFTSSSTATNLLALLEAAGLILPPNIVRASIGPITTQTLVDLNLPPHVEAAEATIPSLVHALTTYNPRPMIASPTADTAARTEETALLKGAASSVP